MIKLFFGFILFLFLFRYISFIVFFICNLKYILPHLFKDIYNFFKKKKYNSFKGFGRIVLFAASGSQVFGSGKTASMIHEVLEIYHRYDGLQVYCEDLQEFVTQRIHIISNVELFDVPYIKFENVNQFVDIDKYEFGPEDVTIYLLDESGAIFNSREFRDNISTEFLARLLQSRKNKVCLYMTSQRLQFTDKILREICSVVVECRKTWRFIRCREYSALDLEYAINPEIVRPLLTRYWFATDRDFANYNSYQIVEQLRKKYKPGDYLSTSEVLQTYGDNSSDLDVNTNIKKKYRSRRKNAS